MHAIYLLYRMTYSREGLNPAGVEDLYQQERQDHTSALKVT